MNEQDRKRILANEANKRAIKMRKERRKRINHSANQERDLILSCDAFLARLDQPQEKPNGTD